MVEYIKKTPIAPGLMEALNVEIKGLSANGQETDDITRSINDQLLAVLGNLPAIVEKIHLEHLDQQRCVQRFINWARLEIAAENIETWLSDNFFYQDGAMVCKHKKFQLRNQSKLTKLPEGLVFYNLYLSGCSALHTIGATVRGHLVVNNCPMVESLNQPDLVSLTVKKSGLKVLEEGCFEKLELESCPIEKLPSLQVGQLRLVELPRLFELPEITPTATKIDLIELPGLKKVPTNLQATENISLLRTRIWDENGKLTTKLSAGNMIALYDLEALVEIDGQVSCKTLKLDNCGTELVDHISVDTVIAKQCPTITLGPNATIRSFLPERSKAIPFYKTGSY